MPGLTNLEHQRLDWSDALFDNLRGVNNVVSLAVETDVESLIFAFSNHAVGMVELKNRPAFITMTHHLRISMNHIGQILSTG